MAWTNAFDLGACTVTLTLNGVQQWAGTLAKGGSQSGTWAAYTAPWVLAVDAAGVVSLTIDDADWQPGAAGGIEVLVTPQVAHNYASRLTSVGGAAVYSVFDVSISATSGTTIATPVPATVDLSALALPNDYIDVGATFSGAP